MSKKRTAAEQERFEKRALVWRREVRRLNAVIRLNNLILRDHTELFRKLHTRTKELEQENDQLRYELDNRVATA